MMRPIKFRAWIKTGNETDDYVEPMTIQQMIHSKESTFSLAQLNDLVDFEQFTGLTDVNGKEIYIGDIVRMQRPRFHECACYEVKYFIQDVCIFQIVKVTDGSTLFESPSNGHDVEIIGNVHTNPELLEEHK